MLKNIYTCLRIAPLPEALRRAGRCKALAINRPAMQLSFILLAGTVSPHGFDIVFFATGENIPK